MHLEHRRRFIAFLALSLLATVLGASPAAAQSLDELRRSGVVGERYDGLVILRDAGASAQIRSFVTDINTERRRIYAQRAAQQGVPADQVGRVYAQEIFRKAPQGTWFLGEDERWTQK